MRRAIAIFLAASLASPAWAERLTGGSDPGIPWGRLFVAFLLCIAVAWVAVLLLKRYQRRGIPHSLTGFLARQGAATRRRITIVETRRASLHADLCLVECDGRTYFLAMTPAGATVLDRQGGSEAPA